MSEGHLDNISIGARPAGGGMESVVRALVVWVRANLLLLLTLAGVVVGVILGAVLSWRS